MNEQQHHTTSPNSAVTVIGLGPMGQAITRTLLTAGHPVTVWNRTAGRAAGVVADGATLAATPREAAGEALPELLASADSIGAILRAAEETPGAALDADEHPGDLSTVTMMGATADHIVETSAALGLDLALPLAVQAHYRHAIGNGHGGDNWTRIIDGIRNA
ncbi:NAD(P)-binding domain-containing protein [Streptomyces sp. NPDC102278]|uniref:imine reductase family protein n=1 Tax=Streptomyces sp. NPDC102278 TaxID=3366152 RepID=UPI003803E296